jgi:hypothetical protein
MSISAPRMTVRTHVPWPMRIGILAVVLALVSLGGFWLYQTGKSFAGFGRNLNEEVVTLRQDNVALRAENARLSAAAGAAQARLDIETSTQAQLGNQIRDLAMENAKLKDDVAFFDNLSANSPTGGVAIKRLVVTKDASAGQIDYRMLITQGGSNDHAFSGDLQLTVTLQQQGKAAMINLPDPNVPGDAKAYQLSFRFFKRLEGTFKVPAGAVVKQVEARLLEHGIVRSQQTVAVD